MFSHFGAFFCLVALILLILCSCSVPINRHLYYLYVDENVSVGAFGFGGTLANRLVLGAWGQFCFTGILTCAWTYEDYRSLYRVGK